MQEGRQAAASPSPTDAPAGNERRFNTRRFAFTLGLLLVLLAAYLLFPAVKREVDRVIFILAMADVYAIRGWVGSAGAWAPVLSLLLMTVTVVIAPLPAVMVTFANAALYGWAMGAFLSWTGAMIGAAICFGLARGLGRDIVARFAPAGLVSRLDEAASKHGAAAVFIARLLPFVSFSAISYAAGLLAIGFWPFLIATGLGQIPATIVYSLAGDLLAVDFGLLVGGIVFMIVVALLVTPLRRLMTGRKDP